MCESCLVWTQLNVDLFLVFLSVKRNLAVFANEIVLKSQKTGHCCHDLPVYCHLFIYQNSIHGLIVLYSFFFLISFWRIYPGAMRRPRDAPVWSKKWLYFWGWRHLVLFLQYGIPPRGGARVSLSWRWKKNVERSFAPMCWFVVIRFLFWIFFP